MDVRTYARVIAPLQFVAGDCQQLANVVLAYSQISDKMASTEPKKVHLIRPSNYSKPVHCHHLGCARAFFVS